MTDRIDRKLEELGLALPQAAAPVASYVPAVEANGLLHISGQLPFKDGQIVTGRLGDGVSLEDGQDAARRCALMLVAQMKAALGSLGRVERIVKLGVFVNSHGDFTDQPKVANRPHGPAVRRCRQACALGGRRARPAARRRGRDRRDRPGLRRLSLTHVPLF
jgi:enamine deaminase RidA (YjgF/YER057c/UK114 family)